MAESCCNPFSLSGHNWSSRKKNLRIVKQWMCEKADISIAMGSKICDSCRKKLATLPDPEIAAKCCCPVKDEQYLDVSETTAAINKCLSEIGETPVVSHNLKRVEDKIGKITTAMKGLY